MKGLRASWRATQAACSLGCQSDPTPAQCNICRSDHTRTEPLQNTWVWGVDMFLVEASDFLMQI